MNQRFLTIGASSVAAILVMALVFLPGSGITGVGTTTTTATTIQSTKPSILPIAHNTGSLLDQLNLVMPAAFTPITLQQAYAMGPSVNMNLVAIEKTIIMPNQVTSGDGCGDTASIATSCLPSQVIAYTFNGTIPGPVIRVPQGAVVTVTVWTPSSDTDEHGADNHASITSATNFLPAASIPGKVTYSFIATQPGVWEYHCEGHVNDLAEHVFRGMHGMVIVDPSSGYTPYTLNFASGSSGSLQTRNVPAAAKEIALDFSEYYLDSSGDFSWKAMYDHNVTYAHINGIPFGYQVLANAGLLPASSGNLPSSNNAEPLQFNQGDHVRFFVLNTGDYPVNFHIVGEILDRVTQGGVVQQGVQTFNLGGSNGAVIDVTFMQAGAFVIVNHDYSQLFKGQAATILVCKNGDAADLCNPLLHETSAGPNPSNAVLTPALNNAGPQTIPQATSPWTFGQPLTGWPGTALTSNQKPLASGGTPDNNFCADTSTDC